MIFPPHNVAKAILTANTEILPWPSLFNDNRKKKKKILFRELPVTRFDIFYSVKFIGYCSCMHYVTTSTLKKAVNTIQTFQKKLSNQCFLFSRDSGIFKLFFIYIKLLKAWTGSQRDMCHLTMD